MRIAAAQEVMNFRSVLIGAWRLPRRFAVGVIRIYQKTLSPDHGPLSRHLPYGVCRFRPTCSEYGATAISRYGLLRGGLMTAWRILRCNPWSAGGHDPVK